MLLVIDAGNSFVKWGYHDGQGWTHKAHASLADFRAAPQRYLDIKPSHIVIGNVSGTQLANVLDDYLKGIPLIWASTPVAACGVRNGYTQPTQLGVDRWAAVVAARALRHDPCVVVSAGTALTVDLLSADGVFLGGAILPGNELMRQALSKGTHAIQPTVGRVTPYPVNTADAVETGLMFALTGAIEKMALALEASQHQAVQCILTGGGAGQISPYLNRPHQVVDNLVLDGLRLMALEKTTT